MPETQDAVRVFVKLLRACHEAASYIPKHCIMRVSQASGESRRNLLLRENCFVQRIQSIRRGNTFSAATLKRGIVGGVVTQHGATSF